MAAVTSLPELFTALPSIFLVNEPEYVVGDLLGSIVFDMVCLLLETLIFVKNFRNAKLQKFHLVNAGACLLMFALPLTLSLLQKNGNSCWVISILFPYLSSLYIS